MEVREYNMGTFKKSDTNVLKGVAILLLLFHHIFYDTWLGGAPPTQVFLIPAVTSIFTKYGAACIFIFALLSGYGISASMEKEMNVKRLTVRREIGLLGTFIPVYFIGLIVMMIDTHSIGGLLTSVYGEDRLHGLINVILDMFGLSNLVGAALLNPTWWYMAAAHLIIFSVPLFVILLGRLEKYNAASALLVFLWLYAAFHQDGVAYIFQYCILTGITGAYLHKFHIIENISGHFASVKGRVVEALLLLALVWVYIFLYVHSGLNSYFVTALFAPVAMFVVKDYIARIRFVAPALQWIGSLSAVMYMSHTFFIRATFLHNFAYHFKYAFVTFLFIFIADVLFAAVLKILMELTGYNRLLGKLRGLA